MADTTPKVSGDAAKENLANLLRQIYAIVEALEMACPGRKFTPDGHLVGSIGEAWASILYDLELLPGSTETHDARTRDGRLVQIKATQGQQISFYDSPDHLIVLRLKRDGTAEEIFNGPGAVAYALCAHKPPAKNGQRSVRLSALSKLMVTVTNLARLPRFVGQIVNEGHS